MLHICEAGAREGWRIFLYGALPETLKDLRERAAHQISGLIYRGQLFPALPAINFRGRKGCSAANQGERRPDFCFLGLSTPKQDKWMFCAPEIRFPAWTMIGVGAGVRFSRRPNTTSAWMDAEKRPGVAVPAVGGTDAIVETLSLHNSEVFAALADAMAGRERIGSNESETFGSGAGFCCRCMWAGRRRNMTRHQ